MPEEQPPTNEQPEDIASANADQQAIVTVSADDEQRDRISSQLFIDRLLENLYGSLFLPRSTFAHLKEYPFVSGGVFMIIMVNLLEAVRLKLTAWQSSLTILVGVLGWLIFSLLLYRLASIFRKDVSLKSLLTLVGFGSTPWLFLGPALSIGQPISIITGIAVMVWFTIWQVRAAATAFDTSFWRMFSLVPLAIAGGYVAIIWTVNVFKLMLSISLSI